MTRNTRRKLLHISMTGFALFIYFAPPVFIVFMCFCALIFNLFILPRISGRYFEREAELKKSYSLGMVLYPASLLLLSLIYFDSLYVVGMAWMVMGFGDGLAGLFGVKFPEPRLSWNRRKSWAGFLSFIFFAFVTAFGFFYFSKFDLSTFGEWQAHREYDFYLFSAAVIFLGVVLAAFLESTEGWIDDNIVVPFSFAFFFSWSYYENVVVLQNSLLQLFTDQWFYLILVVLFASLAYYSRKLDIKGALAGVCVAAILLAAEGVFAFILLAVFFGAGTLASSYQKSLKKKRKLPGSKEKMRSWQNVLANAGPAAIFAFLSMLHPQSSEELIVMMISSLGAATADTLSSELGMVTGKKFYNLLNFKETKAGPDGSVSLAGLFFGLVGALLIGLFSIPVFPMWPVLLVIVFSGFMGTIFDSLLGAGPERAGLMNNHTVNFFACLLAGILAGFCMRYVSPVVF